MMIAHKRVEQEGVHVVADAEGEHADVAARGGVDVVEDRLGVGLAFGRQAVGQEQDGRRALGVGHAERGRQRAVDVRAAFGVHAVDPVNRVLRRDRPTSSWLLKMRQPVLNRIDVEAVAGVEVVEHVCGGLARLIPLVAVHAAGLIEHDDHVARDDRFVRRRRAAAAPAA